MKRQRWRKRKKIERKNKGEIHLDKPNRNTTYQWLTTYNNVLLFGFFACFNYELCIGLILSDKTCLQYSSSRSWTFLVTINSDRNRLLIESVCTFQDIVNILFSQEFQLWRRKVSEWQLCSSLKSRSWIQQEDTCSAQTSLEKMEL